MIKLKKLNVSLIKALNFIVLLDLIFGGSGRLIMIGRLSFRTLLFGAAMLAVIAYSLMGRVKFRGNMFLIILLFVVYLIFNVAFVGDRPLSVKFDYLSRYLYLLMVLFYDIVFFYNGGGITLENIRKTLETMILFFAVFSIALWLLAMKLGGRAYQIIEEGFFAPRVYGNMDFISAGIPRIFMKSSIFIAIGIIFHLDRFIDAPSTIGFVKCALCALAIVTTFTTGFFLATAICVFILLGKKHVFSRKIVIVLFLILVVGIIVIIRLGLIDLMAGRYTGDYSSSYRLVQLKSIINEFLKKPIFGHGFGHEFTTVYGDTVRTTRNFEIAWGEILVDGGIVGVFLFVVIVTTTLQQLFKYAKKYNSNTYYVFAIGLLLIFIESFTNPFINNSIGLTYFAICAGSVSFPNRSKMILDYMENI